MAKSPRGRSNKLSPKGSAIIFALLLILAGAVYLLDSQGIIDFGIAAKGPDKISTSSLPQDNSNLMVWYLDVGQGTSVLVRIPTKSSTDTGYHNMLIDSGDRQYGDGLVEYIKGIGIEEIHTLVVTHPHSDHMGSMDKVINNFQIGQMYMPEIAEQDIPTSKVYESMLDAIESRGVTLKRLYRGALIELPEAVSCQVFSPIQGKAYGDLNNYSGVIKLSFGEASFIFTGDAEGKAEEEMLEAGLDLDAEVLCVGHHGSGTSTSEAFLKAVSPEAGVISCGVDNKYNHPHEQVISRLESLGVNIYRTDRQGTIVAVSDGSAISFETNLESIKEN